MPTIHTTTFIEAPVHTCFDLARNIDIHQKSMSKSGERVIAGRSSGLCEKGDVITWEARHFGLRLKMTVKIIHMEPYVYFEDEMVKGNFKSMNHKHTFESYKNGTLMTDHFSFKAPYGILGSLTENTFLTRYMKNLLITRNNFIKAAAEKI